MSLSFNTPKIIVITTPHVMNLFLTFLSLRFYLLSTLVSQLKREPKMTPFPPHITHTYESFSFRNLLAVTFLSSCLTSLCLFPLLFFFYITTFPLGGVHERFNDHKMRKERESTLIIHYNNQEGERVSRRMNLSDDNVTHTHTHTQVWKRRREKDELGNSRHTHTPSFLTAAVVVVLHLCQHAPIIISVMFLKMGSPGIDFSSIHYHLSILGDYLWKLLFLFLVVLPYHTR